MKKFKVLLHYTGNNVFEMEVLSEDLEELTQRLLKTIAEPQGCFYKQREGQRFGLPGRSVSHFYCEEVKDV